MSGCVYVATNKVNGKQYVGLTRLGVAVRIKHHLYKCRTSKTYFHRALVKYGIENFEVVEYASSVSDSTLADLERLVIAQLAPKYNQTNGGEVTLGRVFDKATVERIRLANTGKKRSSECRKRNSETKKQQLAERPDLRAIALQALEKGRNAPGARERRINAAAASARGRVWSEESRDKLSASCMGRRYGPDIIDRMRASKRRPVRCDNTGIVYSCRIEAAEKCGVSPQSVFRVCNGKYPSVKGFTFSYVR
jgi:group I intron endonuclease